MSADGPAELITHLFDEPPVEGEAIEVAPGILWFRLPLPMKLDHVNCYALDDGDGWTIIDTGFDTRRSRDIWGGVLSGPLAGKPVRRIVATHHHPDHIGLAGWLQTEHDAELTATRTAWTLTRMLSLDVQETPPQENITFMTRAGMDAARLETHRSKRPFNFADIVAPLPLGFTRIGDGDTIQMGQRTWRVVLGDGHAPDHATFWEDGGDLVIAGDQILPGISPHLGVYTSEPDADPVREWLASCRKFRDMARAKHRALPGHKLPFMGVGPRLDQLIENHESALVRMEQFLIEPKRSPDCFMTLFRREIGDMEYGLALSETIAHLNNLLTTGRVRRELAPDGAWLWQSIGHSG